MTMAISKAEWDELTPEGQWQYMQLTEDRESRLTELLNLFECPTHGKGCIPHAIAEVKRMQNTKPLQIRFSPDDRAAILEKLRDRFLQAPNDITDLGARPNVSYGYCDDGNNANRKIVRINNA